MARSRLAALLVVAIMAALAAPVQAQPTPELDKKQAEAIQKIQKLLNEPLIESKHFQTEMPLAKFLAAVEQQLPKDKKVSLRIDNEAFGDKAAEVAATPMRLPASPKKTSLRSALSLALAKTKVQADYRLGATEVKITSPQRALYSVQYEIQDLVAKPETVNLSGSSWQAFRQNRSLRNTDLAQRAALVVQAVVSAIDEFSLKPLPAAAEAIQILNGTQLSVRANAAQHALIADMLQSLRRPSDMTVIVNATLHEVDQALYTKVANAKRLSMEDLEKMERIFLDGKAPQGEPLFKPLDKKSVVLAGDEVKIDNGLEAGFLSWQQAILLLSNPEQVRRGDKGRQAVLEGVSFLAGVQVSADRRFVHMKVTEKSAELKGIHKVKTWDGEIHQIVAEMPLIDENVHGRTEIIPDGGSILVPVHYRPRTILEKKRWWVLSITPRIYIPEEEEQFRIGGLNGILPLLVADVLKNPRLKATRDFYGTSDDKRFALVNSDGWTWSKESRPEVAGYQLTQAKREGNRLLGIRVDKYDDSGKDTAISIALFNAGGNANGAVVGGGTIQYRARSTEKGWTVELVEEP